MKKITLLFLFVALYSMNIFGQKVPRKVLVEAWSGASCAPCAAANPAFHNLVLNTNGAKTVLMKYQFAVGGPDLMYDQTQTIVDARRTYYSVNSAPMARLAGTTPGIGQTSPGHVNYVTQALIDAQYNDSVILSIGLDYSLDATFSNYTARMVVKNVSATDTFKNNGGVVAHLVMTEDDINFPTPPGTTNQKDFHRSSRAFLPNTTGSTLPVQILPGDSVVFTQTIAIPSYIYDLTKLSLVGFVQDNATKKVYQAEYKEPKTSVANAIKASLVDLSAEDKSTLPTGLCTSTFNPVVQVNNLSTFNLSNVTLNFINSTGTNSSSNVASIAAAGNQSVNVPAQTLTNKGVYYYKVYASASAGIKDYNRMNDTIYVGPVFKINTTTDTIIVQNFEGSTLGSNSSMSNAIGHDPLLTGLIFPVTKAISSSATALLGAYAKSTTSYRFKFFDMADQDEASLVFNNISLAGYDSVQVDFSWAYAPYDATYYDQLDIDFSVDCGVNWANIWSKSNTDLATTAATTNLFYPTATQWKSTSFTLPLASKNLSQVSYRFKGVSGNGNNLYVDSITIKGIKKSTVSIRNTALLNSLSVSPNPTSSVLNVVLTTSESKNVTFNVINTLGQKVLSTEKLIEGESTQKLNVSNLAKGTYTLVLEDAGKIIATERFIVE